MVSNRPINICLASSTKRSTVCTSSRLRKESSLKASVGIFCLAYQVGYLVPFAPGGFGPRELVISTLLTPYFGPLAPAISILARLWSVIVDAIAALAALKIKLEKE